MQAPGSMGVVVGGPISIGGHHVRARIGGHHRPSAITGRGHRATGRACAAEQGAALPGPVRRRSRRSSSSWPSRTRTLCGQDPWADRDPVARRLADSEALALTETDLDARTGSVLIRCGKGGKRRWSGRTTGHGSTSRAGPSTGSSCRRAAVLRPCRTDTWADGQQQLARGELRRLVPRLRTAAVRNHTSCGMLTRSRWRTKGSRCRLSRGSSGMRTSDHSIYLQGIDTREIVDTVPTAGHR